MIVVWYECMWYTDMFEIFLEFNLEINIIHNFS